MSRINRIRIVNLNYNHQAFRIDDECFDLATENTLFSLRNGGGKSVFIQMITALFVRKGYRHAGDRKFESYFTTNQPTFIMVEWCLDQGAGYVLTGMMVRKNQEIKDEENSPELEMINFIYEYESENEYDIKHIPILIQEGNKKSLKGFHVCRQLFESCKQNKQLNFYYYDMYQPARSREYFSKLREYQIYSKEWETIIKKVNLKESGLSELFKDAKDEKGLIETWFLKAVKDKLNQHQNRVKAFEELMTKYVNQYKKNEENFKRQEGILLFRQEMETVLTLEEQLLSHESTMLKYQEELAKLYEILELLRKETLQFKEEAESQLTEFKLQTHQLLYEQRSLIIHGLMDELVELGKEQKRQIQQLEQLKAQEGKIQKQAYIYEAARSYQTYVRASEDVQRAESALEVAKKSEQELLPRLQDLGYSLSVVYEEELERKTKEVEKIGWDLKDKEQERLRAQREIQLKQEERQTLSQTIGRLEAMLSQFEQEEKRLSTRYLEPFERNLEGFYLNGWLETKVEQITKELDEAKKQNKKLLEEELKLKEQHHQVSRDLEDLKESLGLVKASVQTSHEKMQRLEEELRIRHNIGRYIEWPEDNVFDKDGMIEAFRQKRQVIEEGLRSYEREIDRLKQEKRQLQAGDVEELPEELSQRLKDVGIQPIRGIEWLKRNGNTMEVNQALIRKNPFLPYSLILNESQMKQLKELSLEVSTSFPIPLLLRESLESTPVFVHASGYCQLDTFPFYVWFNEELLDEQRLAQLLLVKDHSIEELMQKCDRSRETLNHYDNQLATLSYQQLSKDSYQKAKRQVKEAVESQERLHQQIIELQQEKERLNAISESLQKNLRRLKDKVSKLEMKEKDFSLFLKSYADYLKNHRLYLEAKENQERLVEELEALADLQQDLHQSIDRLKSSEQKLHYDLEKTNESFTRFVIYEEGTLIQKDVEDLLSEYDAIEKQMEGAFKQTQDELSRANARFKAAESELDTLTKRYELLDADYRFVTYDCLLEEENLHELSRLKQQYEEQKQVIHALDILKGKIETKKEGEYSRLKRELGETEILDKSQVIVRDFERLLVVNNKQVASMEQKVKDLEKKVEIYEREKSSLSDYQQPLSQALVMDTSYRLYEERDWELKRKLLIRDYRTEKESRGKVERQVSDEFHRLNRLSLVEDEFFLKILSHFDKYKYNPRVFMEQYELKNEVLENLMGQLAVNIQMIEQEKETVIQLLLDYVEEVNQQLKLIDRNSSIPIRGKRVKMLEIEIPKWEENERLYYRRMNEFVHSVTEHCLTLMEENTPVEEFIGTHLKTTLLYDTIVGTANIRIRLFKIEEQREYPITWEQVAKNSGGEGFLSAFVILTSLLSFMRKDETDIFSSCEEGKVLLMDNPFAQTNAAHLLKPLIELAKKNNTQLICLSGLGGDSIYSRFENIYSLSLVPSSFKKGCSYMKSKHIKGEIGQHLLIPSRVYIEEHLEDTEDLLF